MDIFDEIIREDSENYQCKTQLQMSKLIVKYENILNKMRKWKYHDTIFNKAIREEIEERRINNEKDAKRNILRECIKKIKSFLHQLQDHYTKQRDVMHIIQTSNIKENQREKIKCDCGFHISRAHMARHKKTNIHIQIIDKANNIYKETI